MDEKQARALVRDTFQQAFDRARFERFLRDLLNRFEDKPLRYQGAYIREAFKEHVSLLERIGTYIAPGREQIDLLIIHVAKDSTLARARTALRNYVADYLKTRGGKDAALVAFVSPSDNTWRFSWVRMEYATTTDEKGRVGIKTELTPARRLSYLVGQGESCHTAQTRFLELLKKTSHDPTIEELEVAFSVEAVTKEFFEEYKALFLDLNDELGSLLKRDEVLRVDFEQKQIDTVDFAKKLMGQVVFLYFLQKKGWLGVPKGQPWGSGPKDFLRRLTRGEFGVKGNIFNDILEPLFYDALATDRGGAAWCPLFNCRIPFLNGGLFEPIGSYDWVNTDIVLPDRLFMNEERTELGDVGTGILDVFDRYNFTVNEAEPLEVEVAIDPEMLGKVFEKLLDVRERKSKGSFYTPREIVHYMCEESLVTYLHQRLSRRGATIERSDLEAFIRSGEQASSYEAVRVDKEKSRGRRLPASIEAHAAEIDDALSDIYVCDPAIGSGAFPVGMMSEIVRGRLSLNPYFPDLSERTRYHFKRHAIQTSLYGVDIDSSAVDIAKLRLWLSLVVDEEDVAHIKPLPNLDYKIVVGNSLLGFPFTSQRIERIEKLKAEYFDETRHDRKASLKHQIDEELRLAFANSKSNLGYAVTFDFRINFSEVFRGNDGFDVVIANPPYVRHETISDMAPVLRQRFAVAASRADLFIFFFEQGVNLLKSGGVLTLITSNKFHRAAYGVKLRPFLAKQLEIRTLIDFGDAPVFEAIAYASILIGTKAVASEEHTIRAYTWPPERGFGGIHTTLAKDAIDLRQDDLAVDGWRLAGEKAVQLLEKLRTIGTPLGEYVGGRLYYGIKTGLNEAFVLTREQRDRLIREDRRSRELIKPFLRGRDVKRWVAQPQDLFLIAFPYDFNRELKNYPAILKHLKQFETPLKERGQVKASRGNKEGGQHHWLELDNNPKPQYLDAFAKRKVIMPAIEREAAFAVDIDGHYSNDKTNICLAENPHALCAILNSTVLWWALTRIAATKQNGYYEFKPLYVRQLPIPPVSDSDQAKLAALAQRAATATTAADAKTLRKVESEIDEIVAGAFSLSSEDVAHIDGALSRLSPGSPARARTKADRPRTT